MCTYKMERDNPRQSTFSWDDYSRGVAIKPKIGPSILHSFLGQSGKNTFLHWCNGLFTFFELLETVTLEVTFTSGCFITCASKFSSLFFSQLAWIWLLSLEWRGLSNIAFWQYSSKVWNIKFLILFEKWFLTPYTWHLIHCL